MARPQLHPVFAEAKETGALETVTRTPEQITEVIPDAPIQSRFWAAVVEQPDFRDVLRTQIANIVGSPARIQSIKGVYTAGIIRSARYIWAKVSKVCRY